MWHRLGTARWRSFFCVVVAKVGGGDGKTQPKSSKRTVLPILLLGLALARFSGNAPAGRFERSGNDPGVKPFALEGFFGIEGVAGAMFVAKDDIEALVQPFGEQGIDQLRFALVKIALVEIDFGFDNLFAALVEDETIGAAASTGDFHQRIAPQPLDKKVEKAIERIVPGALFQVFSVKGVKAYLCAP